MLITIMVRLVMQVRPHHLSIDVRYQRDIVQLWTGCPNVPCTTRECIILFTSLPPHTRWTALTPSQRWPSSTCSSWSGPPGGLSFLSCKLHNYTWSMLTARTVLSNLNRRLSVPQLPVVWHPTERGTWQLSQSPFGKNSDKDDTSGNLQSWFTWKFFTSGWHLLVDRQEQRGEGMEKVSKLRLWGGRWTRMIKHCGGKHQGRLLRLIQDSCDSWRDLFTIASKKYTKAQTFLVVWYALLCNVSNGFSWKNFVKKTDKVAGW